MAPIQTHGSNEEYPLLHIDRISQYVSLPPSALADPFPAICASIFSPLLLSYYPPAKGIVLAYEDVELSDEAPQPATEKARVQAKARKKSHRDESPVSESDEDEDEKIWGKEVLLKQVDEYAAPFLWATASLLVWRPQRNTWITGHITHQSSTHITLSHLNTFPISILAAQLPSSWSFTMFSPNQKRKGWDGRIADEGGYWVDGDGERVEGEIRVRIRDFDGRMDGKGRGKGFLRLEGSLLTVEEESAGLGYGGRTESGVGKVQKQAKGALRRTHGSSEVMEVD